MESIIKTYQTYKKNKKSNTLYREYYLSIKQNFLDLLNYYKNEKKYRLAIWGAGLKGISFLQTIDPEKKYISYVYDVDDRKIGNKLITGHEVVNYKDEKYKNVQVVFLMNNNYETEVAGLLKDAHMDVILINVDSVIDGNLTADEIIKTQNDTQSNKLRDINSSVSATVILYNCNVDVLHNIESYYKQCDLVYVYDNSTIKNQELIKLFKEYERLVYIDGKGNQGISHALNIVSEIAIKAGYKWLITFDQDSYAEPEMVAKMCDFINYSTIYDKLGIVCPAIKDPVFKFEKVNTEISYNKWVQQSGSMLNLSAFQEIGGFDEALFIDQVDFEYCVRLKMHGYKIVKVNHAVLVHNTSDDNTRFIRKRGRPLYINKYSPMRYYYNTRNILYCSKKYKTVNKQYWESQRRNLGSLLMTLPYEKDKLKRLRAVVLGLIDYIFGNMGKSKRHF